MNDTIRLTVDGAHGDASVDVDLAAGGRIAQIVVRGQPLLIDPGSVAERAATPTGWGSYPMAPWAGRIRHGEFRFRDDDHELDLNQQDGSGDDPERRHAMHGTVFTRPWTVDAQTPHAVTMHCALSPTTLSPTSLRNFGWTFGGIARQTIELLDGQLRCDLSIEVDHHHDPHHSEQLRHDQLRPEHLDVGEPLASTAFLGEIGWHPWFRKPSSVTFHPDAMYERDEIGLPTGRLVDPSPGPWDDCFINTSPVTLHYDDAPIDTVQPPVTTLTLSSDCDHWVIYDEPPHGTCVEPQSGPPDAFNVRPRLVTATHPLRRTMNIAW